MQTPPKAPKAEAAEHAKPAATGGPAE